ncbi:MAG TPA: DUF6691 family protein [Polyangia bacterium]|nr:DUF6691 family protein [Polyangia bacterium]
MKRGATALFSGLLFGAGLVVSGMADPRNVVAFLDVTRAWDPRLAFVMAGAIGVHALALRLGRRVAPVSREPAPIDARLVGGAAIFGVGWGLAGYCPGPAIVSLGFGSPPAWAFVGAMIVGVFLGEAAARTSVDGRAREPVSAC